MVLVSVKIPECGRGKHLAIQLLWATARLLVTRVGLIYLRSKRVFLVTGVNQEN